MEKQAELKDFLLKISSNIFLEINGYGQTLYASSKAQYIFHITEYESFQVFEVFNSSFREHIRNVIYQQYPEHFKIRHQERYYSVSAYPFKENIILNFEDITETRQLSHSLYQTQKRLEFAEKIAHFGYWELNLQTKTFIWSAGMYRIFGLKAHEISQKRNILKERLFPADLSIYKEKLKQLLNFGNPVEGQIRLKKINNKIIYCQFKANIIRQEYKKIIAGTMQDITPLVETQKAYQKARQEAEKSNQSKSYFLAQASHDLRQPLQALNIFIENLQQTQLNEQQSNIVKKIQESSCNLKNMLDSLLDISKLDSGGMSYHPEKIDLSKFLSKICAEYKILGEAKNVKVSYKEPKSIEISIDIMLLERIIRNILSNALKYAKNQIKIFLIQQKNKIEITIIDDGIGIQKEDISKIFDEFYQCQNQLDCKTCGAGLGLSIVKKIINILRGTIRVKSSLNQYTAFKIVLPLK